MSFAFRDDKGQQARLLVPRNPHFESFNIFPPRRVSNGRSVCYAMHIFSRYCMVVQVYTPRDPPPDPLGTAVVCHPNGLMGYEL